MVLHVRPSKNPWSGMSGPLVLHDGVHAGTSQAARTQEAQRSLLTPP
jgi:hypothetical protein